MATEWAKLQKWGSEVLRCLLDTKQEEFAHVKITEISITELPINFADDMAFGKQELPPCIFPRWCSLARPQCHPQRSVIVIGLRDTDSRILEAGVIFHGPGRFDMFSLALQ